METPVDILFTPVEFDPFADLGVPPTGPHNPVPTTDEAVRRGPVADAKKETTATRPAQTSHELLVADLFREYLGVNDVLATDDFFELGGHSLLALQLLDRLELEAGVQLPLSVFLEQSTVEKLAALCTPQHVLSWTPLVPIRPTGTKAPLYLVHGAGSHVLNFNTLIPYLDPEQPVYGLQAQGADGKQKPLETIEEIARQYVEAILDADSSGTYAIAGYSFGGFIAFEIARQLIQLGKKVAFLGMIDAEAFQAHTPTSRADRYLHPVGRAIRLNCHRFRQLLQRPGPTLRALATFCQSKAINAWLRLTMTAQQRQDRLSPTDRMYFVYYRAWLQYRLAPQEVLVDLFRATHQYEFTEDPRYYGWRQYALRGVVVHSVPGGHHSLFQFPNVVVLSEAIQATLNRRMPAVPELLPTAVVTA